MFEVSWSELLILGLVTLIFVGPKDLPRFLGALGRYAGVIRRHANEFRAVFEQAMREAEMDQIQKEIRSVKEGVNASLDEAVRSVDGVREAARIADSAPHAPSVDTPQADTAQANTAPIEAGGAPAAEAPAPPSAPGPSPAPSSDRSEGTG